MKRRKIGRRKSKPKVKKRKTRSKAKKKGKVLTKEDREEAHAMFRESLTFD